MPLDERDAKFEKALRRHFRTECPDAETLAAYHERGLAPEELIFWKKHISGCGNCQEILAQLEKTERVAAEADAVDIGAHKTRDRDNTLPISAPAASYGSARSGATGLAAPVPMPKRRAAGKWAAPAGAIAAGLVVWLSVNELREPSVRTQAPVQVAENRAEAKSQEPPAETRKEQAQPKTLNGRASKTPKPESSAKLQSAAPAAASPARPFKEPMAKTERQDNEENGRMAKTRGNPVEKKQADAREAGRQRLKDEIASDE